VIAITDTTGAIIAIVGSTLIALLVRVSNMVCEWLAKLLGVKPPDPIVPPGKDDTPLAAAPPSSTTPPSTTS